MITIEAYTPEWSHIVQDLGPRPRKALGDVALRIDHIGSTPIPGLAAKPINIQISVAAFDPMKPYRLPLEDLGFQYRDKNLEMTQRTVSRISHVSGNHGRVFDQPHRMARSSAAASRCVCPVAPIPV
jgi:GrpB-like predicted nucleotidyltransferase (UPF0157 family)